MGTQLHQWLTLTENFLGAKGCPVFPFGYLLTQQPLTEHYSMPATVRGAVPAARRKQTNAVPSPASCTPARGQRVSRSYTVSRVVN